MSVYWIAFSLIWLVSGVISYARCLAHFQIKYPTLAANDFYSDRRRAVSWFLLGSPGLICVYFLSRSLPIKFHMFVWKNPHE